MAIEDEIVRLKLNGEAVPIASTYEVESGVMDVPAVFSMTVGHSGIVGDLVAAYRPYVTPFELWIGDTRISQGETDEVSLKGGDGSELNITGRDLVKRLTDTELPGDRTFAEKTFRQLTEIALEECGIDAPLISTDNIANRKAITGIQSVAEVGPTTFFNVATGQQEEAPAAARSTRSTFRTIKVEVGTSWFDFLVDQLRRAGLFIWAAVDGSFVLTAPQGNQAPLYRILRRRTTIDQPGAVTVLGQPSFSHNPSKRFTEVQVFGRGGGGKAGRGKVQASAFDDEMIALLNDDPADRVNGGKRKKKTHIKDDKVRTVAQALFLARRKIAESRRAGWSLSYTVAGHTAPALTGGGQAIWQPDTVVEVVDDELGIEGPMYVESVTYRRSPHTTTTIKLLRIEDLIFAEEDVTAQKAGTRPGLQKARRGVTTVENIRSDTHAIWKRSPQWGNLPVMSTPTRKPKVK